MSLLTLAVLPLTGYGVIYGLAHTPPLSEQTPFYWGLFTLFAIALLLAIPYGILKLIGHAAHLQNPQEKELKLSDLPKDKDELTRSF